MPEIVYGFIAFRNTEGEIIMQTMETSSPIPFMHCNGVPIKIFLIFGPNMCITTINSTRNFCCIHSPKQLICVFTLDV